MRKKDRFKYHSPIVFTTGISDKIRQAFKEYLNAEKGIKKNQAFIKFCNACESENKIPGTVNDLLLEELRNEA